VSHTVYLIGSGPGAVDLLTVRAARLLAQADIVFHDALVPQTILALAAKAEKVSVGKRSGRHSTAQRFINKRLADAAREHRIVVRLKGGDPSVFGRAQEEIDYLRSRGIRIEIVPGVTAALAASAELGMSLTQRGLARSVVFLTPRVGVGEKPNDWARAAAFADTAVIYMGAGEAAAITAALIDAGVAPSTPVVVVENATLEAQQRFTFSLQNLPGIADAALTGPAVILLGEVYAEVEAEAIAAAREQRRA